ncbi:MAG TPA: hypothetical protein VG892_05945 [Terriglobales bacterium]|jgi:hypothetical protein|nr:hypothetical protein [Terriglobales bacterium]
MKNLYDVMRQKEAEIQQLQREIEALRTAARLLADESDTSPDGYRPALAPGATSINNTPGMRPAVPQTSTPVNKVADSTYSAARENSLRQFP